MDGSGRAPGRDWAHNPVTGEIAHLITGVDEGDGRNIEVELWLQPGAAVAGAHTHGAIIERFEVLRGEVGFLVGAEEHGMGPGDGPVEVPVGTVHDWWNSGDDIARVRVEVEAAPGAPGDPATRFVAMIETLWSLGALGKVNAEGMPDQLWLAAIAHEYRDVIQFVKPPALLQAALFPPLAALARRLGRDPSHPSLHGPGAPLWIEDPGPDLSALLDRKVGARDARGHGGA